MPLIRKLIYQLLKGLAYLHAQNIVHRDIKPENLLVAKDHRLKICDFGMARLRVEGEGLSEGVLTEYVASRWYRPPEALLGITTCGESIDMWSAGCVLAEMVLCSPIFRGKSTVDQL
jgi:mitogen-activated protein kinase 15